MTNDPSTRGVAIGLAWRRRWAVWCALVVLVLDAAANAYTDYVVIPATGVTPDRVGQGVTTVLAVAVIATARQLDRRLATRSSPPSGCVIGL